jgi:hypothetical protein
MNEIEAISVLETRIKYPNSDTYDGMCEAEYQQEAVVLAIEALREKQEREKGCAVCSCEYHQELCAEVVRYHSSDFATQEKVDVHYCPNCGKRLDVEHEN